MYLLLRQSHLRALQWKISLSHECWEFPQSFLFLFIHILSVDTQEHIGEGYVESFNVLPECILPWMCLGAVNIADYLTCNIHLTEARYGDVRIANILYLSILRRGSYHIEKLFRLVSTIQWKEDISRNVASIPFWYFERLYENSNVSCRINKTTLK